jgi:nicotinic acid phosphoribosyltransferase
VPEGPGTHDPTVARRFERDPGESLLLTDLYQLNMLQAYRDAGMTATALFEFFVRKLPAGRGFLVAAGLEQVGSAREACAGDPGRGFSARHRDLRERGLDEQLLQRHAAEGVPIDGYGIGTSLTTSQDAPALDCAYKIQEYAGAPKRKRSEGKATWPGRKQVWRRYANGMMAGDVLTLEDHPERNFPGLEPLIEPVMQAGRRIGRLPSLERARERAAAELQRLPQPLRALQPDTTYPVIVSDPLRALARAVDKPA